LTTISDRIRSNTNHPEAIDGRDNQRHSLSQLPYSKRRMQTTTCGEAFVSCVADAMMVDDYAD